LLHQVAR